MSTIASSLVTALVGAKLPGYPMPAALIARLAADERARGVGLRVGETLLIDAFARIAGVAEAIGCLGVLTDAKNEKAEASDFAYFGKLLVELKKDSLALLNFQKSLELEPKQMEIRQTQTDMLMKNKKYADAVPALKALMGLRAKPLSADYYNIGRAYYYIEQYPQADTAFTCSLIQRITDPATDWTGPWAGFHGENTPTPQGE